MLDSMVLPRWVTGFAALNPVHVHQRSRPTHDVVTICNQDSKNMQEKGVM
jgi:hypothetical protein